MKGPQIALVIGAVTTAGILAFCATRKASAEECLMIDGGVRYYGTYIGPTQRVKTALGECWSVIWTLDVYNEEEEDYIPVPNAEQDFLVKGSKIAVQAQAPCRLCGFSLNL